MLYLDMLRDVLGKVSGCPESEAEIAMRNACMEFCTKTRCLLTDTVVQTTGTVGAVDLTEQVLDIIEASINGAPVNVVYANDPDLEDLGPGVYALTFMDPSVATLTPTPPASVPLRLKRVIAPGPASTQVPDVLWLRYSEALTHGCLARLMAASSQSWANPSLSVYHRGEFDEAIAKATAEHGLNRKQVGRRLRVKPI